MLVSPAEIILDTSSSQHIVLWYSCQNNGVCLYGQPQLHVHDTTYMQYKHYESRNVEDHFSPLLFFPFEATAPRSSKRLYEEREIFEHVSAKQLGGAISAR